MSFTASARQNEFYLDPVLFPADSFPFEVSRFANTNGKTAVAAVGGSAIIVFIGQSLYANTSQGNYAPTQANNHTFNISDGQIYRSTAGPTFGANVTGDTDIDFWGKRLADNLIVGAKYPAVIMCNMAIGGTRVAEWTNVTTPPKLGTTIAVMARRLAARGLVPTHILWGQGESDTLAGTSKASYQASLLQIIQMFRDNGITAPFYVNTETLISGNTSIPIQQAQAAVVNGTTIRAGANFDTGIPVADRYDGTHLKATGCATAATIIEAAVFP